MVVGRPLTIEAGQLAPIPGRQLRVEGVRQIHAIDRGGHNYVAIPEALTDHQPVVSLETVELTVLICWAEALAASPDQLNAILDDVGAGAA